MSQMPDLMAFDEVELYFDEPQSPGTAELLAQAAEAYGQPEAEVALLRAYFLAPQQLGVLVALYRYYFYQHRLAETLIVADRALDVSGQRLKLAGDWRTLRLSVIGLVADHSIGLLRFYLLALKASAIVLLRIGQVDAGRERLLKIRELDPQDRLGVASLLEVPGVGKTPEPADA